MKLIANNIHKNIKGKTILNDISLEMELYRQPYCGCIFSEEERYSKKLRQQRRQEAKAKKQLAAAKEQSAK